MVRATKGRADDRRVGLHDEIGVVVGQPPTDAFGIPRGAFERISMLIQPRRVRSSQRPSRTRVTAAGGSSRTMAAPNEPMTRSDTVRPSGRAMPVATMTSSGASRVPGGSPSASILLRRRQDPDEAVCSEQDECGRRHQRDGPDEDARRGLDRHSSVRREPRSGAPGWRTPCRRARCRRRLGSCRGPCRRARAPGRAGGVRWDGWMTSMPAMLDRMHRPVDGRMGDGSPAGGTTSRTGPHRTRPARRAIVAATHRARWRRSAVANRTPRTIAGPLAPTASSLVGCIVPPVTPEDRRGPRPAAEERSGSPRRSRRSCSSWLPLRRLWRPRPDATLRRRGLAAIRHACDDDRRDGLLSESRRLAGRLGTREDRGGRPCRMSRVSGGDWKRGVTFRWSGKLPVGSHAVALSALSRIASPMR